LAEALAEKKRTGGLLGQVLVRKGAISEEDIARAQAIQFSVPYLPAHSYDINPEVASLFPLEFLQKNQFAPVDIFGKVLVVAVSMPLDSEVLSQIEKSTGRTLQIYVSTSTDVAEFQTRLAEAQTKQQARARAAAPQQRSKAAAPVEEPAPSPVGDGKEAAALGDDWQSLLKTVADADFVKELEQNLDRVKADKEEDEDD
jgi:type II secretory ATPase GspE/PulE/Tfp pilus assembly ATPase PilB-like protein